MWDAIKRLVVRGAPAIGVAAAFGIYLGVRHASDDQFPQRLNAVCEYLATSRPTAVNLFWAIERMRRVAQAAAFPEAAKQALLAECLKMIDEDNQVCRTLGALGVKLLEPLAKDGVISLLTHCNAGGLATVQYGTALAPVYVGAERGLKFHVYADETRPLLQGSRITAFELHENNIPVTVICDDMAATVMQQGKVSAVIVGTDRVAANGDVANKIGTLAVAILAEYFALPFYVAAPTSSIDMTLPTGADIPIEQRDPKEISHAFGKQTAPDTVDFYNPAFDVTPASLVTALITERGIVHPPYNASLKRLFTQKSD